MQLARLTLDPLDTYAGTAFSILGPNADRPPHGGAWVKRQARTQKCLGGAPQGR